MRRVGLAKGDESYATTRAALAFVGDDIRVPDGVPVLIKPNMVFRGNALAATPVDAVRAVMEFLITKGVDSGKGGVPPDDQICSPAPISPLHGGKKTPCRTAPMVMLKTP
jgi:hypothetical protein